MRDTQFLKIRVKNGWLFVEVFEHHPEKWKRPNRYHVFRPISCLVNRHQRQSKITLLNQMIETVKRQFRKTFEVKTENENYD